MPAIAMNAVSKFGILRDFQSRTAARKTEGIKTDNCMNGTEFT